MQDVHEGKPGRGDGDACEGRRGGSGTDHLLKMRTGEEEDEKFHHVSPGPIDSADTRSDEGQGDGAEKLNSVVDAGERFREHRVDGERVDEPQPAGRYDECSDQVQRTRGFRGT